MKHYFHYWVCSYTAFMVPTKNQSYLKKLAGTTLDSWYKSYGWIELKALSKQYPLDKFKLSKYGKTFKGYSYDAGNYCNCIEFKAELI